MPHRIAGLLRQWGRKYNRGMRVLRRADNQNPVAFYLLYPTKSESDLNFFKPARNALHLSTLSEIDPFELAENNDQWNDFIIEVPIDEAYMNYNAIYDRYITSLYTMV